MAEPYISLIGNPNSGKTTVFNSLTGSRQQVGNWPGVTTDKKTGYYYFETIKYKVLDLPGTYAIETDPEGVSQDEKVTRNFVLQDQDSVLVNILDASSLQRGLYLTLQLLRLNRPLIVVLNMIDVAKSKGLKVNAKKLEEALGCPVVPLVAYNSKGIEELKKRIARYYQEGLPRKKHIETLDPKIQSIIDEGLKHLDQNSPVFSKYLLLLEEYLSNPAKIASDSELSLQDKEALSHINKTLSDLMGGAGADVALVGARYEVVDRLSKKIVHTSGVASISLTDKIDKLVLGKYTGIPFFLVVMFLVFQFSISIGNACNDFFDILGGAIFVDGTHILLQRMHTPEWLIAVLADGLGAGIQTTLSFIPVLFFMFLVLSFLEDSGYMARAAMVVDRAMRLVGLPGKAFVPMIVGFGCNIPAIMGTRTLENSEDRLLSISMIPFMSCGARLPVYALFAAVFFPYNGGVIVYSLYLLGILIALITGLVLKKTLLSPELSAFVMELPVYHWPTVRGLLLTTWQRLKAFIIKAGRAIVMVVMILGVLNSIDTHGHLQAEHPDQSVLAIGAKKITPLFTPMGLTESNWPATVGIITGVLAKEVVVGTLNSLYQTLANQKEEEEDKPYSLKAAFNEAVSTTFDNLKELPRRLIDPLAVGIELGSNAPSQIEAVEERQEVSAATVGAIRNGFPNHAAVLAYLIFILLYTPCVAAVGAVYRESTLRWTILITLWTFIVAWLGATFYYQATLYLMGEGTNSLKYLIGIPIFLISIFLFLKFFGKRVFID